MKIYGWVFLFLFCALPKAESQAKGRGTTKGATQKIPVPKKYASFREQTSPAERAKLKKSIPALKLKLAKNKSDAKIHLALGKAYLADEDYENAIVHIKEASMNPDRTTMMLLAEGYRGKKDHLNEIRTLEVIRQMNDNDPIVYELLGQAFLETKNFEKAAEHYRKSIALDKTRREPYEGLLRLFDLKKSSYESRVVYQDMIKVFGEDPFPYSGLCRLFTQDKFTDSGIESCMKAISLDPEVPDNHVYLGMNYQFLKDNERASKILAKAAKQFPQSELAQWATGQLYDELKNYETAVLYYKRCAQVDSESARCWYRLAMNSMELKDYATALNAFSKACALDKSVVPDLRSTVSQLRIQNKTEWVSKFQTALDKCGL